LYVFGLSFFDSLRRTPRSAARNEYELTDAIQTHIDDGAVVTASAMMKRDINLTFPYDLLIANLSALTQQERHNLIAESARVHPEARLTHCILGEGVQIDRPIALRHVLMLPAAKISTDETIERAVVTPGNLVDCRYWVDANGQPQAIFTTGQA
jgi:dTDP-glucose pyrophosphorylase